MILVENAIGWDNLDVVALQEACIVNDVEGFSCYQQLRNDDAFCSKRGGLLLFINDKHKVIEVYYNAFYILAVISILGKLVLIANVYVPPATSKYRPASYSTCLAQFVENVNRLRL